MKLSMVLMVGGLVFWPLPGIGQERGSLDEVEALMSQGRILEAREVLEVWWEGRGSAVGRMERQRSLWLRARLTVDPSMAELDLRRLVLEFPGGPFSDDALLRLAQSAELRGDLRAAQSHYSSILRGYPSSPHRNRAELWIRERGPEVEALGPEARPEPPGGRETVIPEGSGEISVQLGAFRSLEGARSLATRVRRAGFGARIVNVPGDDLFRVRVGLFEVREQADSLRQRLEGAGFESTIVSDAQSEERIG